MLGKDPFLENALTELQCALDSVPTNPEITQAPKPVASDLVVADHGSLSVGGGPDIMP